MIVGEQAPQVAAPRQAAAGYYPRRRRHARGTGAHALRAAVEPIAQRARWLYVFGLGPVMAALAAALTYR